MDSLTVNAAFIENAKKSELKQLADAQTAEILRLMHLLKIQGEEIKHLKSLLTTSENIPIIKALSHEEAICLKQIETLRTKSDTEELTFEEGKKLDVYVKLLKIIRSKESDEQSWMKKTDTDALYKAIKESGGH